ncbi:MAG: DUF3710 domain-containing protein, partial [Actinomycetaceae bacterium]|nr:DUF3710 domain-containing protein [Actinomycetaceae bacterium]
MAIRGEGLSETSVMSLESFDSTAGSTLDPEYTATGSQAESFSATFSGPSDVPMKPIQPPIRALARRRDVHRSPVRPTLHHRSDADNESVHSDKESLLLDVHDIRVDGRLARHSEPGMNSSPLPSPLVSFESTEQSTPDVLSEDVDQTSLFHVDDIRLSGAYGPYDISDKEPRAGMLDFGSLILSAVDNAQMQYDSADKYVEYTFDDHAATLRLQVCAAPKSRDLWLKRRAEIAEDIVHHGGTFVEQSDEWGEYLQAQLPSAYSQAGVPVRFYGIDGARWLLLITAHDRAALDDALCSSLMHRLLDECIVVRGNYACVPGECLEVQTPHFIE